MGEDSAEYRAFIAQPSANMDDSGFFSVQVLCLSLSLEYSGSTESSHRSLMKNGMSNAIHVSITKPEGNIARTLCVGPRTCSKGKLRSLCSQSQGFTNRSQCLYLQLQVPPTLPPAFNLTLMTGSTGLPSEDLETSGSISTPSWKAQSW